MTVLFDTDVRKCISNTPGAPQALGFFIECMIVTVQL